MKRRWLVIYYNGNANAAVIIDDDPTDDKVSMPFGVEPEQVAEDCESITAIILCADAPEIPYIVMDDVEIELGEPDLDIPDSEDNPDGN